MFAESVIAKTIFGCVSSNPSGMTLVAAFWIGLEGEPLVCLGYGRFSSKTPI